MSAQVRANEIKNCFCFQGIDHDADLEAKANLKLMRLLAMAPPGAHALGRLECPEHLDPSRIEISAPPH